MSSDGVRFRRADTRCMHLPAKICKDHKSCFLDKQSGENVITCYAVKSAHTFAESLPPYRRWIEHRARVAGTEAARIEIGSEGTTTTLLTGEGGGVGLSRGLEKGSQKNRTQAVTYFTGWHGAGVIRFKSDQGLLGGGLSWPGLQTASGSRCTQRSLLC